MAWRRCLGTSPTIDDDGAPQHPVYHIAAADQKRAYPTAVSIGVTARMIWEVCGLTVAIEERRRRFYDGRTIRWIVATSFISGGGRSEVG